MIVQLIRFDLGFWQTPKQIYRKLKHKEKRLGEFQSLPRFLRKMILYSRSKFDSNILTELFESFKVCLAFPKYCFCIR